jgi:hypothetical protein
VRSTWHDLGLRLSHATARVRGPRPETPARTLPPLPATAQARVEQLRATYGVAFEATYAARTALACYEYLDWLDAAYAAWRIPPARPDELHDVGCGGFGYAAALHRYFAPTRLVGVDVDGYRRLRGGVNRRERVLGHLLALPGAEFVVADYATLRRRADLVTAFFPFVTPAPVLAWRLPLSLLRPDALFGAIRANLLPDGRLLMANHSDAEHAVAVEHARRAGLVRRHVMPSTRPFVPEAPPVVLSYWSVG